MCRGTKYNGVRELTFRGHKFRWRLFSVTWREQKKPEAIFLGRLERGQRRGAKRCRRQAPPFSGSALTAFRLYRYSNEPVPVVSGRNSYVSSNYSNFPWQNSSGPEKLPEFRGSSAFAVSSREKGAGYAHFWGCHGGWLAFINPPALVHPLVTSVGGDGRRFPGSRGAADALVYAQNPNRPCLFVEFPAALRARGGFAGDDHARPRWAVGARKSDGR